ncbi:hypothetical protein F8M41_024248 [Gigaspora margarita]|uniref:Uncharacterized protein n=1 Tax=Gigaspora margarita TaxID=4874 RepID=A0A8H4EEY9_GIGMA|nr:hypothetical protein F8M41_024248 [Gigaspora margarita]
MSKKPSVETSEEEQEDQKELPELEDNNSNNVEKEPIRKNKNISKKYSKIYKRPKVETSEIEQENQEELSEDSNEAENVLEDNDSISSIASIPYFQMMIMIRKKETDKNNE